jgi:hypothetical protein
MTSTTNIQRLAKRVATAEAKAADLRAELEQAAIAMRAEGASLGAIGAVVGMSRPGVLKMLRRHEQAAS